ncbi:MAG: hypothetical protein AAFY56_16980 [Pseudomonadota bacterium]
MTDLLKNYEEINPLLAERLQAKFDRQYEMEPEAFATQAEFEQT